jgi:hypothetical protein
MPDAFQPAMRPAIQPTQTLLRMGTRETLVFDAHQYLIGNCFCTSVLRKIVMPGVNHPATGRCFGACAASPSAFGRVLAHAVLMSEIPLETSRPAGNNPAGPDVLTIRLRGYFFFLTGVRGTAFTALSSTGVSPAVSRVAPTGTRVEVTVFPSAEPEYTVMREGSIPFSVTR